MKLVVMIPAYNEEETVGKVIHEIPRSIKGIDDVEVLVIDDGSIDGTVDAAREAGADKIVSHKENLGLAPAFQFGLDTALEMGADIIVNTDADFQYNQAEIPRIIQSILEHKADVVLTDRNVLGLDHMPFGKKYGNTLATWVTRFVSGFPVRDAQSGFRAFSREAALRLHVLSDYTYVQETIIQAVEKRLTINQVPCEFRERKGTGSRLISSIWSYAKRAGAMIMRTYIRYKPLKAFLTLGALIFTPGFLLGLRFLTYWLQGTGTGHIQSLILGSMLMMVGFQIMILALLADTIDANRRVSEELLCRLKAI